MFLISEHIQPELLWAYPYNALRNHAVMRATTNVRPNNHQISRHAAYCCYFLSR
jgi:hypothetical protein